MAGNDEDKFLPQEQWPHTVDEAVDLLLAKLSDADREKFKHTSESDLMIYHHGFGTYIRNQFGLWKGNKGLLKSCGGEGLHPDGASTVIINALWERLNG